MQIDILTTKDLQDFETRLNETLAKIDANMLKRHEAIVALIGGPTAAPNLQPVGATAKMILTFADEFDTAASFPNDRWATVDANGNRTLAPNKERQKYVDQTYKGSDGKLLGVDPFRVDGSVLTIKARPAANAALLNWPADNGLYTFTSGWVSSHRSFSQLYGWFEARMKLPAAQPGLWPAFWLLPIDKSWPPEIDILECVPGEPSTLYTTMHAKEGNIGHGTKTPSPLSVDFHVYGVDWREDRITWYLDGREVFACVPKPSVSKPMYLLLNLAVGGTWPEQILGAPNPKDDYSRADLLIDYVRVWK